MNDLTIWTKAVFYSKGQDRDITFNIVILIPNYTSISMFHVHKLPLQNPHSLLKSSISTFIIYLNWSSVTPLPIALVLDTPPVTIFSKLST